MADYLNFSTENKKKKNPPGYLILLRTAAKNGKNPTVLYMHGGGLGAVSNTTPTRYTCEDPITVLLLLLLLVASYKSVLKF